MEDPKKLKIEIPLLLLLSRSVMSDSLQPQTRLSFTTSRSWLKLTSIESVMPLSSAI